MRANIKDILVQLEGISNVAFSVTKLVFNKDVKRNPIDLTVSLL
jgi:hypothetical protein